MKEFGLDEGIYAISDAVKITGQSYGKIRRWFKELSETDYEGLSGTVRSDIENLRISFHGLIELVVIGTLRENNFRLRQILKARQYLKEKSGKSYPFATNDANKNLKIAGRTIIFQFPSGKVSLDGTGQYNLELIREFFRHIRFNTDGIAEKLFPQKGKNIIVIDPKEGDGKPIVNGKGVPAETINQFYQGPETIPNLKREYGLEEEEIMAAIDYCN